MTARRVAGVFLGAFLVGLALVWHLGSVLVAPSPARLTAPTDLAVETVSIPSRGAIAGWFVAGRQGGGAVLLLHGVRANRSAMLGRARFLAARGFAVLLIDLQAHGESPGDAITFGARESADVRAALAWLRGRLPREHVGVIGCSLGGAAALLGPQPLGADAVVLEAVYPAVEAAVTNRIAIRLGRPLARLLAPLLVAQLHPRLGIGPSELRPIDHIAALGAPVLLVAGSEDAHTTPADTERLFVAAAEPKNLWMVPGAAHVDLYAFAGPEYEQRVGAFLRNALQRAGI